ncbi:hypothetical protein AAFA46_01505 [Oscillospiraceae bacterium WX1]
MKITNIKNVIIASLLILNVFFLAFCLMHLLEDGQSREDRHQTLEALVKKNGMTLDVAGLEEGGVLHTLKTSRDTAGEAAMAKALLGETTVQEQGGSVTYSGQNGQAVFNNGGDFNVTFQTGVVHADEGKAVIMIQKLLKTLDIETSSLEAAPDGGKVVVTAVSAYKGTPILNCRLIFTFQNGSLVSFSGKRVYTLAETEEKTDMTAASTAVTVLLNAVKTGRVTCTKILAAQPGYLLIASSAYGDATVRPIWQLTTDTGVYLYDTQTGNLEPAA